jgi:hypothetical protein
MGKNVRIKSKDENQIVGMHTVYTHMPDSNGKEVLTAFPFFNGISVDKIDGPAERKLRDSGFIV